jgi:hypothetical protein
MIGTIDDALKKGDSKVKADKSNNVSNEKPEKATEKQIN